MSDTMPPLTTGAQLIDQLVQAVIKVCNQPHGHGNSDRLADVRTSLQKYMTTLEKETGRYHEHVKNSGGRPGGLHDGRPPNHERPGRVEIYEGAGGWYVWIKGFSRDDGPYKRRVDARTASRKMVAELKRHLL